MSVAFQLPAWTDEDAIPHDRAVWREYTGKPAHAGKRVSLEHHDGAISITHGHLADWSTCKRWRFGWPPR